MFYPWQFSYLLCWHSALSPVSKCESSYLWTFLHRKCLFHQVCTWFIYYWGEEVLSLCLAAAKGQWACSSFSGSVNRCFFWEVVTESLPSFRLRWGLNGGNPNCMESTTWENSWTQSGHFSQCSAKFDKHHRSGITEKGSTCMWTAALVL